MSLGGYPFNVLSEIQGITSHLLARFTTEQIIKSFSGVARVLADFRRNHPDQIPTKPCGGLLDMGPLPFNDFELAQHLIGASDPEMTTVINESEGVPVLIAYLEVITNSKDLPDKYLLESALPCAVETLAVEGEDAKRWGLQLKIESDRAAKNLRERNAINAASPRPNGRAIDHEDVLKEYLRLIQQDHTDREARGILVSRGNMGSQSTIYRITKNK